jgi:hypothetical protein
MLNCPVDVPSLVDIKLDGKLVKLEQLLQLQPWRKPTGAATDSNSADGSTAAAAAAAAAAASSSAAAGGNGGKKALRPKAYKVVEFTVKAAAVLAGHEAPVLPPQLLQWALQVRGGLGFYHITDGFGFVVCCCASSGGGAACIQCS